MKEAAKRVNMRQSRDCVDNRMSDGRKKAKSVGGMMM